MDPWRRSLGAPFVSSDWQVRVLWSYGLVDRPFDCLCVRNINLSGCMDRRSRYNSLIRLNSFYFMLQFNELELTVLPLGPPWKVLKDVPNHIPENMIG